LITSAPMSQRIMDANGPDRIQVRSRTVMSDKGLLMVTPMIAACHGTRNSKPG
jgi:hypothetical protein